MELALLGERVLPADAWSQALASSHGILEARSTHETVVGELTAREIARPASLMPRSEGNLRPNGSVFRSSALG